MPPFAAVRSLLPGAALVLAGAVHPLPASAMIEAQTLPQTRDGRPIQTFTLRNAGGMSAKLTTYGAMLTGLHAPARDGKTADVVLGFDSIEPYLKGHPFFGNTTGRYANRIAGAQFTLNGETYRLAANSGPNHIHGGPQGLDKKNWKPTVNEAANSVTFEHLSPDGDEGYPGNLGLKVTYTLTDKNELRIDYEATTDKDTVINLTNHSYFNLAGAGSGDVLGHVLRLHADTYTVPDDALIPTGEIRPVAGTPLDFRAPQPIGARWDQLPEKLKGYDHNFVLNDWSPGKLVPAADLYEPKSGRRMKTYTTEPGVQIYTAIHLGGVTGKDGRTYGKYGGVCLETQHFPDSPNRPAFPTTVLKKGDTFRSTTVYAFSAE